jgi:hypothetical protein
MEFLLGLSNRPVVDAGQPQVHETVVIELPVFVAIGAKPVASVIAPLISKTHSDATPIMRPQLFDKPVVQFPRPFALQ